MKHGHELSFDDEGKPVLITRAAVSYEEQHRQRVRKYLLLMSVRIPALVFAAIAYGIWHNGLLSLAIVVVSIPLAWMAVVIANDRPARKADEPRRYQAAPSLGPAAEQPSLESPAFDQWADPPAQPESGDRPGDVPS
ncbi:DUF3099 domain-containing protein [Mycolicibacterium sp. XJ1819]